jgi:hypothetical protein
MKKPRIRPCAGTCGRDTRSSDMKLADYPGTVIRDRMDTCSSCLRGKRPFTTPQMRMCKGTCGRMTRPAHLKADMFDQPTVSRANAEYCASCQREANGLRVNPTWRGKAANPDTGTKPCAGTCGRDTRPYEAKAADHPGTVRRRRNGLCDGCNFEAEIERKRAAALAEIEATPWRRQLVVSRANDAFNPEKVAPDADPRLVLQAESFARERRARLARMQRTPSFAQTHAINMSRRGILA